MAGAHATYLVGDASGDLMLAEPERFGAEYVTDLQWTKIDFPQDVLRARELILPQLEMLP